MPAWWARSPWTSRRRHSPQQTCQDHWELKSRSIRLELLVLKVLVWGRRISLPLGRANRMPMCFASIVLSIRANYAGLGGIEANVERVIGHDILPPVVRDRKMPEPVERVIPHTPLPREVIDTKTPTATAPSGIAIGRKSETASGLPHTGRILLRGDAVRCDWVGKDSADTIAFFDNVWTQYFLATQPLGSTARRGCRGSRLLTRATWAARKPRNIL